MSDDKACFVAKIRDGLERRRLAKYKPYCQNEYNGYQSEQRTKKRRNEKRRYYR